MKIQLYSIEHAPRSLPFWQTLMDDLCNPPPERVAKVLGLSARTIHRYNKTGHAPRSVCLAVFWLTSWGRATVYAQAFNDAQIAIGCMTGLESRIEQLEGLIAHLRAIGQFGAANDPGTVPPRPRGFHALPR